MKLTAILILAACLQVSASGYSQKVTLSEKNAPMGKVFRSIKKQTGYAFFFDESWMRQAGTVTIEVKEEPLEMVLDLCFKNKPLTYSIVGNTIVVKLRAPVQNVKEDVQLAYLTIAVEIRGVVTDEINKGLQGVSLTIKGSDKGVTTDVNGNFTIELPDDGGVLVISYVGYEVVERTVTRSGTLNVALKRKDSKIDEVVVIGYGSVKKSDLTGAVSSLSSEKITQVKAISNVAQALQGQAAGVQVNQASGQPGEVMIIKIRGTNSVGASNAPLYVVDGLPLTGLTAQLNPDDIASMEVLKDASATAIYGSRGANGVILITTKKGKEGKAQVSYNGYFGVQTLRKKLDLINAKEFAQLQNEVAANDGTALKWTPAQIDSLGNGTDWQHIVYRPANVQNHDVSVSGGSANTKYYTSFGYYDQDGIIKNSNVRRMSFRVNLDQKISNRLNFNTSFSLQQTRFQSANHANADYGGVPFQTMVMPPTVGVYDADGKYTTFTGVSWGKQILWVWPGKYQTLRLPYVS